MLEDIKRFYKQNNLYDYIFLSLIASLLVFIPLRVAALQLGYIYGKTYITSIIYTEAFLVVLSTLLPLIIVLKPKVHLSKNKKLLLVLELIFSFFVVYVIL